MPLEHIYYQITAKNRVAVIYYGEDYSNVPAKNMYTGSVVIPESVTYEGVTYSVTSIGYQAFYNCTGLTSVSIPEGVTSIGSYAFSLCSSLTSVTIPNSVLSIGSGAFDGCTGLTEVAIGNSVTEIGDYAFNNCKSLTSITIPGSVTSIGYSVFPTNVTTGCKISNIYIDNIATICNDIWSVLRRAESVNLYLNNELVTNLVIPEGVTSIAKNTFQYCKSINSITLPNSITSIGNSAFIVFVLFLSHPR